eukprot:5551660-Pyramimonas_sp.AAC.1
MAAERTDDNQDQRQTHDGRQSTVQAVMDTLLQQDSLGLSEEAAQDLANNILRAAQACESSGNAQRQPTVEDSNDDSWKEVDTVWPK